MPFFQPGDAGSNLVAYLNGYRDSIDQTLALLGNQSSQAVSEISSQSGSQSWCLDLIGIRAEASNFTGAGIKAAVLDTGLDLKHPDFIDRENLKSKNFLEFY